MTPAPKNYYRDVESGGTIGISSDVSGEPPSYYQQSKTKNNPDTFYPPIIIRHPEPTKTTATTTDNASQITGAGSHSSRTRKTNKQSTRLLRWPGFLSMGRKSNRSSSRPNNTIAEQEGILQHNDLKSGGTFDSTTVGGGTENDQQSRYEHPRSQSRMAQKWGTLFREQLLPSDQWTRSLDQARELMERSRASGDHDDGLSREELVKEARDRIRSLMEFSLWHCLLAIVVYVAFSVYCFSYWLEDWSIVDSVYFAVVTFTTIGYGDVVPDTLESRMFTCFWALSGVACLGIALGVLGSNLIQVAEREQKKAHDKHKYEVIDMFHGDLTSNDSAYRNSRSPARPSSQSHNHIYPVSSLDDTSQWSELGGGVEDYFRNPFRNEHDDDDDDDPSKCRQCITSNKTKRLILLFIFLVVILYGISLSEDWTIPSTLYYGLITASTVGYGDLSPQTEQGRLLAILYIPVAVGLMGILLDVVAYSIIAYRQAKAEEMLKTKELTLRDLAVMDGDGDGTVTRAEFLEFMLVAMNQVDQDTLDSLKEHFDRLDRDRSGALDKSDLVKLAQKKLGSERNLKRSMY